MRGWSPPSVADDRRPDTDADTRQAFIRDKYEHKRFCQFNQAGGSREKALADCVESDSLMETIELIAAGVPRECVDPDTGHSILFLARAAEQELQAELLRQNGFALMESELES